MLLFTCLAAVATGCSPSTPADPAAPSTDSYGYGEDEYLRCLDDHDVQYRQTSDGKVNSSEVVNQSDPDVAEATRLCDRLTTQPASDAYTAYANEVTRAIVACLVAQGYHAATSDDGLGNGNGTTQLSFDVPDAERNSPDYPAAQTACLTQAEQSIPSPST